MFYKLNTEWAGILNKIAYGTKYRYMAIGFLLKYHHSIKHKIYSFTVNLKTSSS